MLAYFRKTTLKGRLEMLALSNLVPEEVLDKEYMSGYQQKLNTKLIEAGFLDSGEQNKINRYKVLVYLGGILFGAIVAFLLKQTPLSLIVGSFFGLYFSLVAWVLWLKAKARDVVRSAYFDLPLLLEELILLIESGLGLFPALEKVCSFDPGEFVNGDPGVCRESFKKAFSLAVHGMPVSEAFALVSRNASCIPLKQVLIHLDVSASIGGELLTSLRALSDQVHKEWKLQVETRVKRLENTVVFPVFMAVMGLLLLTSAVPLVPVFEFMSSLKSGSSTVSPEYSELQKQGGQLK